MTLTFFGPAEAGLPTPYKWPIHNVTTVLVDGWDVHVTIGHKTHVLATIEPVDGHVKYVISNKGWFALFYSHPPHSRMAYAGMQLK